MDAAIDGAPRDTGQFTACQRKHQTTDQLSASTMPSAHRPLSLGAIREETTRQPQLGWRLAIGKTGERVRTVRACSVDRIHKAAKWCVVEGFITSKRCPSHTCNDRPAIMMRSRGFGVGKWRQTHLRRHHSTTAAGAPSPFAPTYGLWIDNQDQALSSSSSRLLLRNPATREPLTEVSLAGPSDVDRAVRSAAASFEDGTWARAMDARARSKVRHASRHSVVVVGAGPIFVVISRAPLFHTTHTHAHKVLLEMARLLERRLPTLAAMEALQTGRALREMRAQLGRLPEWLEYFSAVGRTHEGVCPPFPGPYHNYVKRVPLGVCAQITPWNHPLLIALKKLAPALAAGNSVVVKPPEMAPVAVLELGRIAQEVGKKEPWGGDRVRRTGPPSRPFFVPHDNLL